MPDKEFEKLINDRKDLARALKSNECDLDGILTGLYNDPSHFIYEILQNAEGWAKANEITFEISEDKLDIYYSGIDFDFKDIKRITTIGQSKGKDDLNTIGKFGIGFKSVFAITQTPFIYSGKYNIHIKDFVVPSVVEKSNNKSGTKISLPFNHKFRSKEEVFYLISKKLEDIGLKTLLFLQNINEIKWKTPNINGHYLKSPEKIEQVENAKKVTIISDKDTEEYLVIEKPIKIENYDLKVEVAYKLGKDKSEKEIIIPETDSKLFVYFPTEKDTYMNFVIQGPYKTTPNRENIPLEDKQNKEILEETANLVAESLSVIKDLGYLDTKFLSLLPINPEYKEKTLIYSVIYDKVKEKFLTTELLPTCNGKYAKASDALLSGSEKLTEFLNEDDIQILFDKKDWLETTITDVKARELRNYLMKELKIPEVDFESFARKITAEFLQTKSDEWMIDFYGWLLDRSTREKSILKTKPIIRLETNEHITPFDNNGKVQVYLPAETKSEYRTVKHILTENDNALKFLEELGLKKPDLLAEVTEFILPKYQKQSPIKDEKHFEDFEKLLKAYETIPSNKKCEFIEELKKASFIDSVKNNTGENHLRKPSGVYFKDNDLIDYFDGYNSVYFIADGLYEKLDKERLKSFLIDLDVEDKPRRIEIDCNLSWEEKSKLRGDIRHSRDIDQKDYEYEGLENFLKQITVDKSYLLWRLLLKNIQSLNSWEAQKFFEGEYSWSYYRKYDKSLKAKFTKTLRQQAWLVDKNNNFVRPSDITFSEASDSYIKEDILIKALEFKLEIIDQLSENDRRILEIAKNSGLTPKELEKLLSERNEKSLEKEEKQWMPECEPDAVSVRTQGVEPDKIITPDLTGQGGKTDTGKVKGTTKGKDVPETLPDRKAIGEWGEKYVYNALKEEYQKLGSFTETDSGFKVLNVGNEELEIVWLNKHRDRGEGYDFVIRKNGTEIRYIEVKAKTQEVEELIEVTGTQWEFARKLFEQNEGEKYYFYVVLNAGKENAKIHILKNPIKLWKEGKLYAHPVNFKL